MKRLIVATGLATALVAGGCQDAPSEDQCKQLLDHLVDLEFKKAGAVASKAGAAIGTDGVGAATGMVDTLKADLTKQKLAVSAAKSTEFVSTCVDKTAKGRVVCALAAADLEAVAKCDEVK